MHFMHATHPHALHACTPCRAGVRSEPRYIVSGAPAITGGTGFVSTLSLMSKFGGLRRRRAPGCMRLLAAEARRQGCFVQRMC